LKVETLQEKEKVTFFVSQNNCLKAIISRYGRKSSKFFLICKKILQRFLINFDLKYCI